MRAKELYKLQGCVGTTLSFQAYGQELPKIS
jgi:hypothetical protein